jgi:hypothetical protein
MCPSTEVTDAQSAFAADVLRKLLLHIDAENPNANADRGHYTFLVSHAWTEGAMMYVLYTAPPSDITWGLVRDTRESNIDPGPWLDLDEAVRFYYLLDFEENWPGRFSRQPGEPDTIRWSGLRHERLPELVSDISEAHRYTPSAGAPSAERDRDRDRAVGTEPRRYGETP